MDTTALQRALIALGLYKGKIDGAAGPVTKAAVVAFQRSAGLYPDGVAGPRTIAKLQQVLADAKPASAIPPAGKAVPAHWMPPGRLERVICHWTAGQHRASALDRGHRRHPQLFHGRLLALLFDQDRP